MKVLLDTNVVLRFVLRDHESMSAAAYRLFAQAASGEVQLVLDPVIVAECCFVLSGKVYAYAKRDIAMVMGKLVLLDGVVVDDAARVSDALELFARQHIDFADAYLAATARANEIPVATFDHDFDKLGISLHPLL